MDQEQKARATVSCLIVVVFVPGIIVQLPRPSFKNQASLAMVGCLKAHFLRPKSPADFQDCLLGNKKIAHRLLPEGLHFRSRSRLIFRPIILGTEDHVLTIM